MHIAKISVESAIYREYIYRDLGANIVSSMDFFIESAREAATLLSASFSSLS